MRRRQSPIYTQQATPHPEPDRVSLTHTAEARVALRPAAPATPSPVAPCAGTEKTDKRAPPETRYRRTRQKQPLYPKESDASITGTVVEFDP